MTNINCAENCTYSVNGKCTLNQIATSLNLLNLTNTCAYYIPKETIKKTPQKT
ncbi:hydroxymyristoyl-ACP dehydratase [Clostridium sp. SYSU_GA19001]|uniref:hydroxymyristoyl-ACP dehydratase n=1 Tax=Clostridium caldaquaticum TaxID=2940653 RepID=UPI0020777CED|nr:hydroxymyristoyl-ACP dehydratase [Clostridium caldaquaticum]MCM8711863.1 hydroxymyristoyl-ACP dehydratase [Clostridium caldaquaticum]